MSLNLRINRQRPQKSRWRLRWLLAATVLAVAWLVWWQGWNPAPSLARWTEELPPLPVEIPALSVAAPSPAEAVVMVNSQLSTPPKAKPLPPFVPRYRQG